MARDANVIDKFDLKLINPDYDGEIEIELDLSLHVTSMLDEYTSTSPRGPTWFVDEDDTDSDNVIDAAEDGESWDNSIVPLDEPSIFSNVFQSTHSRINLSETLVSTRSAYSVDQVEARMLMAYARVQRNVERRLVSSNVISQSSRKKQAGFIAWALLQGVYNANDTYVKSAVSELAGLPGKGPLALEGEGSDFGADRDISIEMLDGVLSTVRDNTGRIPDLWVANGPMKATVSGLFVDSGEYGIIASQFDELPSKEQLAVLNTVDIFATEYGYAYLTYSELAEANKLLMLNSMKSRIAYFRKNKAEQYETADDSQRWVIKTDFAAMPKKPGCNAVIVNVNDS